MGDQFVQGEMARHGCKIIGVLWSDKMHIIPDNVIDKILQQSVPIHVKELQNFLRGSWC